MKTKFITENIPIYKYQRSKCKPVYIKPLLFEKQKANYQSIKNPYQKKKIRNIFLTKPIKIIFI